MAVLSRTVALAFNFAAVAVHGLRRLADEEHLNATIPLPDDVANGTAFLSQVAPASAAAVAPGSGVVYSPAIETVLGGPVHWTYLPPDPRVGIVTGGLPDEYGIKGYATRTSEILKMYAKKKGYALYIDKNIGRHIDRNPKWAKLHVMHQLVDSVPLLVWIDPDVVLTKLDFSLEVLIKQSTCQGERQTRWDEYLPKEVKNDTFLWLSADEHNGGIDQYEVNAAPGVVVLRRGPLTKEFLEKVWKVGENPGYFMKHRYAAKPRQGQTGEWPYEMGAFWDVLAGNPGKYMRKACIAPIGHLHSLNSENFHLAMNLRRLADKTDSRKRSIADGYFNTFNLNPSIL
mmetsp:Transcript_50368/g.146137  ORF Transcript_50368/g.146137 Transcript_50368/m.146137 type:complete len:343 (-) Transcript_50368:69-1097(-)